VSGLPLLLALVFAAAPPASPRPPSRLRLEGLDRLYFARVGGAGSLTAPAEVSAFLPLAIARSPRLPDPAKLEGVSVRDIPLPVPRWPRPALLRQVVLSGARIDELWLALYDGGRRSEVWHFQARPDLTDGKLLPNYWVGGARAGAGETVVLDLGGTMYRPQGGWWLHQREVTLAVRGDTVALQHVRGTYGFIHDYDRGDDTNPPAFSVMAEHVVDGRFERRELYPVSVAAIKACGAEVADDYIEPGTNDLRAVAECVTRDPRSTVTWRRLDEPSFAERGYKAPPPE
jgi:hypothetical protein